jgi:hypothetical protein
LTESSERKSRRKPFIYAAVAVAAATGLLVAHLGGVFDAERGTITADDVCRNLPDRQAAAGILNSVLPQAARYDFVTRSTPTPDWDYISNCSGTGDGKNVLNLHAKAGVAMPWRQWADHSLPPSSGKRTYFNSGIKGVSTADLAAIYIPCYRNEKKTKEPYNLTVFAQAPEGLESSDKEARRTLIDLATAVGRYAHEEAKCDLQSKLPD